MFQEARECTNNSSQRAFNNQKYNNNFFYSAIPTASLLMALYNSIRTLL